MTEIREDDFDVVLPWPNSNNILHYFDKDEFNLSITHELVSFIH